ncbi:MAG: hypothetical protein GY804_06070 [Alphaproteobacteria bacterium]|nr:hypothetical protein [Alphaproteobacteria bacterium]
MQLKDFIKTTLVDISEAVYEAKNQVADKTAIASGFLEGEFQQATHIEFDIAVTAKDEENNKLEGNGNIGAKIIEVINANASVGKKSEQNSATEHSSRISFKVPIHFGAKLK